MMKKRKLKKIKKLYLIKHNDPVVLKTGYLFQPEICVYKYWNNNNKFDYLRFADVYDKKELSKLKIDNSTIVSWIEEANSVLI